MEELVNDIIEYRKTADGVSTTHSLSLREFDKHGHNIINHFDTLKITIDKNNEEDKVVKITIPLV